MTLLQGRVRVAPVLAQNLARVRERIAQACLRCGRDPAAVTLICVTKGIPAGTVAGLIQLGVTDIGENRVQEALAKQAVLGSKYKVEGNLGPSTLNLAPLRWHLIGHLQRNKAKDAVASFAMIHSVDSAALAQELQRHAAKRVQGPRLKVEGKPVEPVGVFIQVNVSGETTKFGCEAEEVVGLARVVTQLSHLRLMGLMTLAPFAEDPERARPYFRRLRQLRDNIASALNLQPSTLNLSMGMSGDFEVAIEEGADFVRVGTAIVGPREHTQ